MWISLLVPDTTGDRDDVLNWRFGDRLPKVVVSLSVIPQQAPSYSTFDFRLRVTWYFGPDG